jgi:hypothetical protein
MGEDDKSDDRAESSRIWSSNGTGDDGRHGPRRTSKLEHLKEELLEDAMAISRSYLVKTLE